VRAATSLGVRRARREAQALLKQFRIRDAKDLDVTAIANLFRLRVAHGNLDGAAARLARAGRYGTIRLNSKIADVGARRFSTAHELGHCVLRHEPRDVRALCEAPHERPDGETEAQANAFAAELLMPEAMLRRRCEVSPVDLEPARAIASEFNVSLLAAALRFVELTSERCALVFARDRRVVWVCRSDSFAPFIERQRPIDPQSCTFDWFRHGTISEGCQPVPADAWIDHDSAVDADIWEESIPVPAMHGVMSLLWIPESVARPFDRE